MQITHHGLPDHLVGPYKALRRQALIKLLTDESERTRRAIKSRSPTAIAGLVAGAMSACLAETYTLDTPAPVRTIFAAANELAAHIMEMMEYADQQPLPAMFRIEVVDATYLNAVEISCLIKRHTNELEVAQ